MLLRVVQRERRRPARVSKKTEQCVCVPRSAAVVRLNCCLKGREKPKPLCEGEPQPA